MHDQSTTVPKIFGTTNSSCWNHEVRSPKVPEKDFFLYNLDTAITKMDRYACNLFHKYDKTFLLAYPHLSRQGDFGRIRQDFFLW